MLAISLARVVAEFERFVEQAGEAPQALLEIVSARVERRDEHLDVCVPIGDRLRGSAVALLQKLHRLGERAPVGIELDGKIAEIAQHLDGHIVESAQVFFHFGGGGSALAGHVVHGGDEFGNARHHRVLDRVHVLVGAAEHLLQQDIGLAQALEQGGGIRAQHAVRLQHICHGRRGGLFRLFDRRFGRAVQILKRSRNARLRGFGDALSAFLKLPQRARYCRGGGLARFVDQAGNLLAVVHHRLCEDEALGLDRLYRLIGDAGHFAGELLTLAGQCCEQLVRFLVERARHLPHALGYGGVDVIGSADDIARNVGAHANQRALGLARTAADRVGGGAGGLGDEIGSGGGCIADRCAGGCGALAERFARGRGGPADRLGGGRGALTERFAAAGG